MQNVCVLQSFDPLAKRKYIAKGLTNNSRNSAQRLETLMRHHPAPPWACHIGCIACSTTAYH